MSSRPQDDAVDELLQSVGLLLRRVRAVNAGQELSMTERAVMARLFREGPATTADLARAEAIKPQSMGATVASLEERGIVSRRPHATDGRQMLIELTEAGAALREIGKDAKRTWLAQAMAELAPGEQETLLAAGRIMRRLVKL